MSKQKNFIRAVLGATLVGAVAGTIAGANFSMLPIFALIGGLVTTAAALYGGFIYWLYNRLVQGRTPYRVAPALLASSLLVCLVVLTFLGSSGLQGDCGGMIVFMSLLILLPAIIIAAIFGSGVGQR